MSEECVSIGSRSSGERTSAGLRMSGEYESKNAQESMNNCVCDSECGGTRAGEREGARGCDSEDAQESMGERACESECEDTRGSMRECVRVGECEGVQSPHHGIFITFEGGDGAGKTTHIKLLAEFLRGGGREVVCVREPGGTEIGEGVRNILLDPKNEQMCDECELLLYVAARAQIVSEVIKPALARRSVVLCDRFTDSTLAYQGFARGLDRDFIERANVFATGDLMPDRTILLTCGSAESSMSRVRKRVEGEEQEHVDVGEYAREQAEGGAQESVVIDGCECAGEKSSASIDRIELAGENFHNKVNFAFLELASMYPERFRIIDSSQEKEVTAKQIRDSLADLFIEI